MFEIAYHTSVTWPPEPDETLECPFCHVPMGPQPKFRVEVDDLRQIFPGQDAVPVADCIYSCPWCKCVHYIRYIPA